MLIQRFNPLLFLAVFLFLTIGAEHSIAQPKKGKKKASTEKKTTDQVTPALERTDSLIVKECNLPLVDSADDRPTFSLDGKIMVFGSRRPPMPGETWRQPRPGLFGWDGDVYYRLLTDTGWTIPINPGPPINNGNDQNNPTISPRGDEIYFVSGGGGNVMRSKFVDGKLQTPQQVVGQIQVVYQNLAYYQAYFHDTLLNGINKQLAADSNLADVFRRAPESREVYVKERILRSLKDNGGVKFFQLFSRFESTFSPDFKYVIFAENFGKKNKYGMDGEGDDDLWAIKISPNGRWDTVSAINGKINSGFAETYPFFAADNRTLYFTSDRICSNCPPGSTGGDDIYMTKFSDTGFTKPVPLPAPINSPYGDYGFTVAPDGKTAYFVSNRTGKSKFYQVNLRPQDSAFTPMPVIVFTGFVTDKVTGKPVAARIFVDELAQNQSSFNVYSDPGLGSYALAMQRGQRYGLQVIADGYLPKSERFTFPAKGDFNRNKLDFQLEPISIGATAEFKNVYFSFGKTDLLPESKPELNRVSDFLKSNRTASIEIDGHTDDVGTPAANEKLSLDRANTVMNYLIAQGVSKERLSAKGFGKSKPLKKGNDEASRALNRRVEMVVTSYSK